MLQNNGFKDNSNSNKSTHFINDSDEWLDANKISKNGLKKMVYNNDISQLRKLCEIAAIDSSESKQCIYKTLTTEHMLTTTPDRLCPSIRQLILSYNNCDNSNNILDLMSGTGQITKFIPVEICKKIYEVEKDIR